MQQPAPAPEAWAKQQAYPNHNRVRLGNDVPPSEVVCGSGADAAYLESKINARDSALRSQLALAAAEADRLAGLLSAANARAEELTDERDQLRSRAEAGEKAWTLIEELRAQGYYVAVATEPNDDRTAYTGPWRVRVGDCTIIDGKLSLLESLNKALERSPKMQYDLSPLVPKPAPPTPAAGRESAESDEAMLDEAWRKFQHSPSPIYREYGKEVLRVYRAARTPARMDEGEIRRRFREFGYSKRQCVEDEFVNFTLSLFAPQETKP